MNYSRHRLYLKALKELMEKHSAEIGKLSGEKRQKLEDQLKKKATLISLNRKEDKEEVKEEAKKEVSKKKVKEIKKAE